MKIATLNVRGIASPHRFQESFALLNNFHIDILLLQETNLSLVGKHPIDDFDIEGIYCPCISRWSGVTIAYRKSAPFTLIDSQELVQGSLMRADFHWNDATLILYNIHMPKSDLVALDLIAKLNQNLLSIPPDSLVCGRDFNCT